MVRLESRQLVCHQVVIQHLHSSMVRLEREHFNAIIPIESLFTFQYG